MTAVKQGRMSMPTGIIVLIAYEVMVMLYGLYNLLVVAPAAQHQVQKMMSQMPHNGPPPPPGLTAGMSAMMGVGIVLALSWMLVLGFMVLGFAMRWSFARIMGIIRYALNIASGLLGVVGAAIMVFMFMSLRHTMGQMGKTMPPPIAMPGSDPIQIGLKLFMSFVGLCVAIFGVWYLTTDTAKEYFSD
jgi:hypothetical protein